MTLFRARTLPPTTLERIKEPERRVAARGDQGFVFLFPGIRQTMLRLLPCADGLECLLPPSCPRAAPAYNFGRRLVADVFQAATLEEYWELASEPGSYPRNVHHSPSLYAPW